jgi:energy-coupling factor transport system permease protein
MISGLRCYTSGSTMIHGLHPLSKLFVLMLVCVAAFLFEPWYVASALAVAIALLHAPREIGMKRLLSVLRPLPLFVALIVLANIFLIPRLGPWWRNAETGLLQAVRVVTVIMGANLYLAVTDPIDLSDAVLRMVRPFRRFGLRTGELSLMVMIVFSFIPLMTEEARRLQIAQAVRCGFPRRGVNAVKTAVYLLTPLVIGVFRRTDEIDASLRVRCYRIDAPRSSLPNSRAGMLDYLVCAASVMIFLAGVYAQF